MLFWSVPIAVVVLTLVAFGLLRRRIPRDATRELPDTPASNLAYDRGSHSVLFVFFRAIILNKLENFQPRGTLLDAGCGPGHLALAISRRYPGLRVVGVDISEQMLGLAGNNRSRASSPVQITFRQADVASLPFDDNSVEFVTSSLSLHHWQNARAAFEEMHRVLKPGGQLLIFDLRRDAPYLLHFGAGLVQRFICPVPIRRTNGVCGSFWASYTPSEMKELALSSPFKSWKVQEGWGWTYIMAQKQA